METPETPSPAEDRSAAGCDGRADAEALADLSAGRLIDSDAVARWLGGWHLARAGEVPVTPGYPDAASGSNSVFASDRAIGDVRRPSATMPPQPRRLLGRSDGDVTAAGPSLMWTDTAVRECDRLRRTLATLGREAEDRLAAALVGVMVRLIADGPDRRDGIFDVALLSTLCLRIVSVDGAMAVIGPRSTDAIV